jgi:hypothetical protein
MPREKQNHLMLAAETINVIKSFSLPKNIPQRKRTVLKLYEKYMRILNVHRKSLEKGKNHHPI